MTLAPVKDYFDPRLLFDLGRNTMSNDVFEGRWKQVRGQARVWWGRLMHDDLEQVGGKFNQLSGLL